ncbi:MAG: BON domain-containing protein [Proteobacteria bacterium]|nr:BON domain-containing protein [Pseudomonadota bacterium]
MKTFNIGIMLIGALLLSNQAIAADVKPFTLTAVMGSETDSDKSKPESSTKKDVKEYLSDSEITAKVKEKFIEEKLFGKEKISAMGLHVRTKNGVVTLKGKVANNDEVDTAVKLTKSVEGVKDVVSKIKVKQTKKK